MVANYFPSPRLTTVPVSKRFTLMLSSHSSIFCGAWPGLQIRDWGPLEKVLRLLLSIYFHVLSSGFFFLLHFWIFIYSIFSVWVFCLYVYPHTIMYAYRSQKRVPPWNWSYRWQWAAMWTLGTEPEFSGRAASTLNSCIISSLETSFLRTVNLGSTPCVVLISYSIAPLYRLALGRLSLGTKVPLIHYWWILKM